MSYRQLLAQNKIIRQLSLLQFFAYFGAWFSHVAIYTLLIKYEASALIISLVVAVNFLPSILLSPFLGTLIDRFPVKKFMLILLSIEILMTFSFFFINSLDDIYFLMITLFIRMASASAFFTSEMALIPNLIDDKLLSKANEIHSIIWSFTFTAGMALGGIVVHNFGIQSAFIIDIILFLIAIFILINTKFELEIIQSTQSIFLDIKDGFYYLKNNKKLMQLILLHSTIGFTAFDSLVTLLADYHYKYIISVPLAIGITNGLRALALMIGPLFISNWVNKQRLFYLFLFQALALVFWGSLQYNFYLGLVSIFFTGIVTTTLWSYTYAMLQEEIEAKFLGRILSYNEMAFMIMNIFTTLLIGLLASFVGLNFITFILALAFILTAIYYKKVFL